MDEILKFEMVSRYNNFYQHQKLHLLSGIFFFSNATPKSGKSVFQLL
ncbi:MAG: hypothetical protein RL675_710 [Bacteroidota bacterium]|jgi:hypothetical protein